MEKWRRDYAKGILSQADYRQKRAELIRGILAGKVEIKDYEFEELFDPSDITEQNEFFDPFATTEISDITTVPGAMKAKANPAPPPKQTENKKQTPAPTNRGKAKKTSKPSRSNHTENKLAWLLIAICVVILIALALTFFSHSNTFQ